VSRTEKAQTTKKRGLTKKILFFRGGRCYRAKNQCAKSHKVGLRVRTMLKNAKWPTGQTADGHRPAQQRARKSLKSSATRRAAKRIAALNIVRKKNKEFSQHLLGQLKKNGRKERRKARRGITQDPAVNKSSRTRTNGREIRSPGRYQ